MIRNKLDLEETTKRFYNVYEKVAKEYGYKTREDTKELEEKDKEIERLNNIINELEKYLNKVIETSTEQEKITCSFVLQHLQELKGEDKE